MFNPQIGLHSLLPLVTEAVTSSVNVLSRSSFCSRNRCSRVSGEQVGCYGAWEAKNKRAVSPSVCSSKHLPRSLLFHILHAWLLVLLCFSQLPELYLHIYYQGWRTVLPATQPAPWYCLCFMSRPVDPVFLWFCAYCPGWPVSRKQTGL